VRQLVAAGGDADTNGAVLGALVGCRVGFRALPHEWVAQMPYAAWLEAHVKKLLFMLALPDL
jgi:ADP-ribosylglycohydrolase